MRTRRLLWIPAAALALAATPGFADDSPAAMADSLDDRPAASAPATSARVARAVFTREMNGREPGAAVGTLPASANEIYFFTDLRGLAGKRVTHRWEHAGAVLAEVPFDVRGPRWRVHSSKQLLPGWGGTWKVSVVDDAGRVLETATFEYELPKDD